MRSTIYTTYGMAMGHRPEALAASGGLRPITREPLSIPQGLARVRRSLRAVIARVRQRRSNADATPKVAEVMTVTAIPGDQWGPSPAMALSIMISSHATTTDLTSEPCNAGSCSQFEAQVTR